MELRKLSDIKLYPGNPRLHGAIVGVVAASIKQFGFCQPIVVDAEGVIICGHTREQLSRCARRRNVVPPYVLGTSRPVAPGVSGPAVRAFYTYNAVKRK
jgi:hypothetical protein